MFVTRLLTKWFELAGWKKIGYGLIAGILTGSLLQEKTIYLQPIGTLFIHAIQMLVVPVVMTAIVCSVISIKQFDKMGKMILKALSIYAVTMAIAATIGIVIANGLNIGKGLVVEHAPNTIVPHALTLGEVLVSFVPTSPVQAFATNNVMQILCFALLFGIALRMVGDKGKPIQTLFTSLSDVVFQFAKIIIGFAPYGVFALIACVIGRYGLGALLPLIKFVGAVYLSCGLLFILLYAPLLFINRINPYFFLKNVSEALITAFTTSSSAATLPITMRCARENLNIDRTISDFLLPLGTTLNLNGLAIYLSVATVFAANAFGIDLTFPQYISLVITIVFTATGAAAIPGSALIVMGAVMSSVGIPLTALPMLAGVDRFNDMSQTMTNVAGDLVAATLVAKSEGMIETSSHPGVEIEEKVLESSTVS